MKKKILLFLMIFALILTLIACNKSEPVNKEKEINKVTEENKDDSKENKKKEKEEKTELESKENEEKRDEEKKEKEVAKKEGIQSPLSGLYDTKEKINRRIVAIMFDNQKYARWQSGLSKAEIVYEMLVEGNITRYMGLFLKNDPELIGPVRSARPYFITALLQYDPLYVRCGGSPQAKKDVNGLKIADVDGLAAPGYLFQRYNETGKKIPHNLYTGMSKIRKYQRARNYREESSFDGFKFNSEDNDIKGVNAETILIKYSSRNTTKYVYDAEKKKYKRFKDGKEHIDEYDKEQLYAKNIIIQKAKTKIIDSIGRLDIELIGKGKAIYITNGKATEITWKKENRNSRTIYYNKDGSQLKLNPGITWIQVTKSKPNISIK
ncbi:MAG: DUF3048 domain-containing protein [Firmicutes bacterium]|nr:DUF3048 domain-containing protein [Bacillota bacterium]